MYRVYTAEILRFYAESHGAEVKRYIDLISDEAPETGAQAAQSAREQVLAEFKRLRGEE